MLQDDANTNRRTPASFPARARAMEVYRGGTMGTNSRAPAGESRRMKVGRMIRRIARLANRAATPLRWLPETQPRDERAALLQSYLRICMPRDRRVASRTRNRVRIFDMSVNYFDRAPLLSMFIEIFMRQEYAFVARTESPLIVDAGANIGLATLFFKHRYPDARILAFEPEPETFAMLQRNVSGNHLSDVSLFQLALGRDNGSVRLQGSPGNLATTTLEGVWDDPLTDSLVEAARLSSFIDEPVDMLKLDIEGAEQAVLEDLVAASKLHLIREMVVEYHHHIAPEESSLGDLLALLDANGFGYQVAADFNEPWHRGSLRRPSTPGVYQDVLVYAYALAQSPP
jgi:FkbM family methyltransferase